MAKVLGVGGVFFQSSDPEWLYAWYEKHLGIARGDEPGVSFPDAANYTVWRIYDPDSDEYSPTHKEYKFNLVVDDLNGALEQVAEGAAKIVGQVDTATNGIFGWFVDPHGNKVELWEPLK